MVPCLKTIDIDQPITVTKSSSSNGGFVPSPEAIENIVAMGLSEAQAKKALRETVSFPSTKDANLVNRPNAKVDVLLAFQGNDAERAVDWIFSHPEDTGEDVEMTAPSASEQTGYGGSASLPAKYRLRAFVSHKGPSVHSGHYVATVRQDDGKWVLFNDEKVVKAEGEANDKMKSLAYLYIYERLGL